MDDLTRKHDNIVFSQQRFDDDHSLFEHKVHAYMDDEQLNIVILPTHELNELNLGRMLTPLDGYAFHDTMELDINDFNASFIASNRQYTNSQLLSGPFAKTADITLYDQDRFENNDVPSPDEKLTWQDIKTYDSHMDAQTIDKGFISVNDSVSLFISGLKQRNIPYITDTGDAFFNAPETRTMLKDYKAMMEKGTLMFDTSPSNTEAQSAFASGQTVLTQIPSHTLTSNLPDNDDAFNVGVRPAIQHSISNPSVMHQGYNLAILQNPYRPSNNQDAELRVSWEIVKTLTSTENTSMLSKQTGTIPVRQSAYGHADYRTFLETKDHDPYAAVGAIHQSQREWFTHEETYRIGSTPSLVVRKEIGELMQRLEDDAPVKSTYETLIEAWKNEPVHPLIP